MRFRKKIKSVPPTTTCNARRRNGQLCKNPAGARTSHLGVGRCRRHNGDSMRFLKHGRYAQVKHARIREILNDLVSVESQVMDLVPEMNLLRAMTIDHLNRFDEFQEALMAWYADPESNTRPRKIMDISDAASLIEATSRVVQRMHQINSEGAISLETFKRVTELMGMIVAKYVKDPLALNSIEAEWMELALDAKAPPHAAAEPPALAPETETIH